MLSRKRTLNKHLKTVVLSVRVTEELRDRLDLLAMKSNLTRNHWIVKTLTREATPKKRADNASD